MRRSKSDWLFLIREQLDSGMTAVDYCSAHEINVISFYSARRRYRDCLAQTADHETNRADETSMTDAGPESEAMNPGESVKFVQVSVEDFSVPAFTDRPVLHPSGLQPDRICSAGVSPPQTVPEQEVLDFFCNGIRLILPGNISNHSLHRIMKVCTAL